MNYILMPGRNRAEFFDIALSSLMGCPEIENYRILFEFECDVQQEYYDIIKRYVKCPSQIEIKRWDTHYGLTRGHLEGMKIAFNNTDEYVIIVEDDVMVSRDFLRYHDYCYRNFYKERGDIGTITGQISHASVSKEPEERDPKLVHKRLWYHPYGVLIPKDFFYKYVLEHCTEKYYKNPLYVDTVYPEWSERGKWFEQAGLLNRIVHKNNLHTIEADVPRCQDIGWFGKNRTNRYAEYKTLNLDEKIRLNRKIWGDIDLIKKFAYSGSQHYVLNNNNEWDNLVLVGD